MTRLHPRSHCPKPRAQPPPKAAASSAHVPHRQEREEQEELEWALQAVAKLSSNLEGAQLEPSPPPPPACGSTALSSERRPPSGGSAKDEFEAAESQLQQLVELGFPKEVAARHCDGVTPVEELVERMVQESDPDARGRGPEEGSTTPRSRKPKAPFHWAAKRMMGK